MNLTYGIWDPKPSKQLFLGSVALKKFTNQSKNDRSVL